MNYQQAMKQAEDILEKLSKEDFDIDTLAENVKQATELLGVCRQKLQKAESELEEVISQQQ